MLFHVLGANTIYQWIAMFGVLLGLILLNEFSRRTKMGGMIMFFIVPTLLTFYCHRCLRSYGNGLGIEESNLCLYEWLVPLCEIICCFGGMYWFHDDQISVGNWTRPLI